MDVANTTTTPTNASSSTAAAVSAGVSGGNKLNLIIKASNQQYDDQMIESDLMWTVKRLKTQLSLVYPSKPPVAEQKLIYSGQLLIDTLQLKDVIRSYKDVYTQNHIFHLVYTPKNAPPPNLTQKPKLTTAAANMSTTDGLRQRFVAGFQQQQQMQTQPQQQQQQLPAQYMQQQPNFIPYTFNANNATSSLQAAQCPPYDPNNPQNAMPFSFPNEFNMQTLATQQTAMYNWMQQVYSQYLDQYLRLSNTAEGLASMSTQNAATGGNSLIANPYLQQMPFIAPNVATAAAAASETATNPVIPFPSATSTAAAYFAQQRPLQRAATAQSQVAAPVVAVAPAAVNNEQQQQQPQPQPQQEQPQPRFPNIVQEEQDNRDWLDGFFQVTRLALFLTILYFNSSPLRCLFVVLIAGGIYLYHIGFFRCRNERNNNNINRNNNAAADQIRQGVEQVQQAQAAQQQQQQQQEAENPPNDAAEQIDAAAQPNEAAEPLLAAAANNDAAAVENPVGSAAAAAEELDNNTNSVISIVRTFVVTFFTSLLPETPAL